MKYEYEALMKLYWQEKNQNR